MNCFELYRFGQSVKGGIGRALVAAGATELGLNDMDLGQADEVMEFILSHLSQVKSSLFGCSMHDAITLQSN